MTTFVYVQHLKNPEIRFQVTEFDKTTKQGKLKGEFGATFTKVLTPEELAKHGYELIRSETELPLVSSPSKTKGVASTKKEE